MLPDRQEMKGETPGEASFRLVHEGWGHLKLQRPLAAWASWRRALRFLDWNVAATRALDLLASADDLPAAARASYRFLGPRDEDRPRWDSAFQGRDPQELEVATAAFAALAEGDPTDAPARYNHALCLAWLGRNAEAIAALDAFVRLVAASQSDRAVWAWALAEILRQGAGAEDLADDLDHIVTIPWGPDRADVANIIERDLLRPQPTPLDPMSGRPVDDVRVYDWLSGPMPDASRTHSGADVPRVQATILFREGSLRFSTPRAMADHEVDWLLAHGPGAEYKATPLPLRLMDAATWTFRLPEGLDQETRRDLTREMIEGYFENAWIHRARKGLDGRSPLEAGRLAAEGDAAARAKLAAVILVREQLGRRPRVAALYAGYPFDRLRRRVNLEPLDPEAVEPTDYSCMGPVELGKLDVSAMDADALDEAFRSARNLQDTRGLDSPYDALVTRFATGLVDREPRVLVRDEYPWPLPHVLRGELDRAGPEGVLAWIDRAIAIDAEHYRGRDRILLETARALIADAGVDALYFERNPHSEAYFRERLSFKGYSSAFLFKLLHRDAKYDFAEDMAMWLEGVGRDQESKAVYHWAHRFPPNPPNAWVPPCPLCDEARLRAEGPA